MDHHTLVDLTSADLQPWRSSKTAVRLYIGNNWYAGIFKSFLISQEPNYVYLDPYVHFKHHSSTPADEPGKKLVNGGDKPVTFAENGQPFRIVNPQKAVSRDDAADTMIIKFEGGVMILSHRMDDLVATEQLLEDAKTLSS